MLKASSGRYIALSADQQSAAMKEVTRRWHTFFEEVKSVLPKQHVQDVDYQCNTYALREMVERIHMRKDYFFRYHSQMVMSEFKEIGLAMFWLSKLKPFSISGDRIDKRIAFQINDDFAVYYMLTALHNLANEKGWECDTRKISNDLYHEIFYTLCFRDLSKESLGLIVELTANIVIPDLANKLKELKSK